MESLENRLEHAELSFASEQAQLTDRVAPQSFADADTTFTSEIIQISHTISDTFACAN